MSCGLVRILGADSERKTIGSVRPVSTRFSAISGEFCTVYVVLKNDSPVSWCSSEGNDIYLSYHWYDTSGELVVYDGERSPIRDSIKPGEVRMIPLTVKTPPGSGDFFYEATLIREGHYWLDDCGLIRWLISAHIELPALSPRASQIYGKLRSAIKINFQEKSQCVL